MTFLLTPAVVKITTATKDQQPKGTSAGALRLESVVAKVDTLRFSIRDSKHDLLYKTMRPLATALIKRQICKAIEDGIRGAFEMADAQIRSSPVTPRSIQALTTITLARKQVQPGNA